MLPLLLFTLPLRLQFSGLFDTYYSIFCATGRCTFSFYQCNITLCWVCIRYRIHSIYLSWWISFRFCLICPRFCPITSFCCSATYIPLVSNLKYKYTIHNISNMATSHSLLMSQANQTVTTGCWSWSQCHDTDSLNKKNFDSEPSQPKENLYC